MIWESRQHEARLWKDEKRGGAGILCRRISQPVARQRWSENYNFWKGFLLDDNLENRLFAMQRKRTERIMKIMVALLAAVFLFVLYFLVQNG